MKQSHESVLVKALNGKTGSLSFIVGASARSEFECKRYVFPPASVDDPVLIEEISVESEWANRTGNIPPIARAIDEHGSEFREPIGACMFSDDNGKTWRSLVSRSRSRCCNE